MKLADKMPMDESMISKPSFVCFGPSEVNIKHAEPQLIDDCVDASFVGRSQDEAKAGAQKHASNFSLRRLKLQASDTCLKNFVIFDHCKGQNTVILHPSWLQAPPHQSSLEPDPMEEVNCFLDRLQAFDSKSVDTMIGIHSSAALCPALRDQPALLMQQTLYPQKCSSIDGVHCDAYNFKQQGLGASMHVDADGDFHENTEEINALLSSDDDELSSTGHSPSDGASVSHSRTINRSGMNISGKKRKMEDLTGDEVDDADSGSCQLSPGLAALQGRRFGSSDSLQFPGESSHKSIPSGVGHRDTPGEATMRSTFYASKQSIVNEGQYESKQSFGMFGDGGLMDRSKRIKVKSNMQQLKNIIPGGNLLDTAGVLGRTVHYVKCLQEKLRGLEAARESPRVMHQIW